MLSKSRRTFKEPHFEAQYEAMPVRLKEVAAEFEALSIALGVTPVVTRITDAVKGESGVHPAGRAIDYRDEYAPGKYLYDQEEADYLVEEINERFPRTDGKLVIIHHSFQGGAWHYHIQIPVGWLTA